MHQLYMCIYKHIIDIYMEREREGERERERERGIFFFSHIDYYRKKYKKFRKGSRIWHPKI